MLETHESSATADVVLGHFIAKGKGLFKVALCIHDCLAVRIQTAVLKVMVEAAVIQIDRSADSHNVVRDTHLCMAEAGCKLKDPDAVTGQPVIVRACQAVNDLFIRNAGCDDPDINASLCRQRQNVIRYGVMYQT